MTASLDDYQRKVARLTAENQELRERLATQERTAKAAERRLRAERDEGVAPQVAALQLTNNALRERLDKAKRVDRDMTSVYRRMATRFCVHLVQEHGMTVEAAQAFVHTASDQTYDITLPLEAIAAVDGEKIGRGRALDGSRPGAR